MGMANKPPPSSYKRTFHVISHASNERYRERFAGSGIEHLDEEHLGNHIDWAVVQSRKSGQGIEIIDSKDNAPGEIVPLDEVPTLWALVKPNTVRRLSDTRPFAIVTVLTDQQVQRSMRSGKWRKPGEAPKPPPRSFTLPPEQLEKLASLRDKVTNTTRAANEESAAPVKLEFKNLMGDAVHRDCATIREAEELINNPPQGLSYVCAWVPAPTREVKRTELQIKEGS